MGNEYVFLILNIRPSFIYPKNFRKLVNVKSFYCFMLIEIIIIIIK